MHNSIPAARTRALIHASLERPGCPLPLQRLAGRMTFPDRLLVADVAHQRLMLLEAGRLTASYPISTALNGLGSEDGSLKTPLGWHRIHACIGSGQPRGMIFKARVPTGEIWQGETRTEDLITTRILTLEGLEEGYNCGPGVDSLMRYIYIHGTNQESCLGQPLSKGCLRMSNADVLDLFEKVQAGDPLLIVDLPAGDLGRIHFVGIAGSGMSALAQFLSVSLSQKRVTGKSSHIHAFVSGSDRCFDRVQQPERRQQLERLDIALYPQDGSAVKTSGVSDICDCSGVVYSTAVEETVPDFAMAKELGVPLIHRSELLAYIVSAMRTLAITGTSGKSTTTAMVFEILRGAGCDPSLITGGDLRLLQEEGHWGNAWRGAGATQKSQPELSNLLVIEADESDGSVVRYHPAVGVVLNLQKDHKEESVVLEMFQSFRQNTKECFILGEHDNLTGLSSQARVFGFQSGAHTRCANLNLHPEYSTFQVEDTLFRLPVPGRHNVENALAAIAACQALGLALKDMVEPLARFKGVARRFQILGEKKGVTVIDDFGHNPAKVAASLVTAQARAGKGRVLAAFQPHGYGPTRFMWKELVESFCAHVRSQDTLHLLEVFYAGGTANRDFSSADMVREIAERGVNAAFAPSRERLAEDLAKTAQAGDLVIIMGARDPSLTALALNVLEKL